MRSIRAPLGLRPAAVAAVAAVAALALGAGVAAWPHGGGAAPARPAPFDGILAGAPLQRATCTNWRAAPAEQRQGTVRALSDTLGGASTSGGRGTTLPDGQVAQLFDRVCSTPATSGFALYLIYARAAAFSRTVPPPAT